MTQEPIFVQLTSDLKVQRRVTDFVMQIMTQPYLLLTESLELMMCTDFGVEMVADHLITKIKNDGKLIYDSETKQVYRDAQAMADTMLKLGELKLRL